MLIIFEQKNLFVRGGMEENKYGAETTEEYVYIMSERNYTKETGKILCLNPWAIRGVFFICFCVLLWKAPLLAELWVQNIFRLCH